MWECCSIVNLYSAFPFPFCLLSRSGHYSRSVPAKIPSDPQDLGSDPTQRKDDPEFLKIDNLAKTTVINDISAADLR